MLADTGLILRRQRLSETSLILTWLTQEHGLQRTAAKAALRPKNPFFGQLDLYFSCELCWFASRSTDLHTLKETRLLAARLPLRSHHRKLEIAAWFTHLILACTEAETPAPEQFHLLTLALDYLAEHPPQRRLLERFESRLSRILGLGSGHDPQAALARLEALFALQIRRRPVIPL